MYEDFLYEMENGVYYHFEFESDSISESDLRRFREYEASTVRIYGAPVVAFAVKFLDKQELGLIKEEMEMTIHGERNGERKKRGIRALWPTDPETHRRE